MKARHRVAALWAAIHDSLLQILLPFGRRKGEIILGAMSSLQIIFYEGLRLTLVPDRRFFFVQKPFLASFGGPKKVMALCTQSPFFLENK